jgi:hypothetical protein
MSDRAPLRSLILAPLAILGAAYLAQGFVRKASWRANVAWSVKSWWRPADREARWQQAVGRAVDPWDRMLHGEGARGRGGDDRETRPASSMGQ